MLTEELLFIRNICVNIAPPSLKILDIGYLMGPAEEIFKSINENSVDLVFFARRY